jgi:hypothetical protein
MVLISIHPFAVRKIFLLAVALLGASSALCFADPLFMTRQYGHSRDQALPAQAVAALETNSGELSSSWFFFEVCDLRTLAVSDPGEIGPVFSKTKADVFTKATVCWRSNARANPAVFGSETTQAP